MNISASTCGFTWSFLTLTDPWARLPLPSEASELPGARRWTTGTRLPFPSKLSHDLLLLPMC